MTKDSHILLTGAAGFIGSCMLRHLNEQAFTNIIIVDDFGVESKRPNWEQKHFLKNIERQYLFEWLESEKPAIDAVIHLGARTDTTEFDYAIHEQLNVVYSQKIWTYCTEQQIPLIYASSAATYGDGSLGYQDDNDLAFKLTPLNPYGRSKNQFDKWALEQETQPPAWAGLKFFNVYGPNEYHKGRMASVIFHAYNQMKQSAHVKLFKSHRPDFKDGEQLRDFIYVKDIIAVIDWMMHQMVQENWNQKKNGLYNLGTGKARSFYDLAQSTFYGAGIEPDIEFIDMPQDLRTTYQYFTEATMQKLASVGYANEFYSLENGVQDYVSNYLVPGKYF